MKILKKKYVLISLPIKFNNRTIIQPQTLDNCLQSLTDVIRELDLKSFCINKSDYFDDLPWSYVIARIKAHLLDIPIHVTICKNLIQTPTEAEREALNNRKPFISIRWSQGSYQNL